MGEARGVSSRRQGGWVREYHRLEARGPSATFESAFALRPGKLSGGGLRAGRGPGLDSRFGSRGCLAGVRAKRTHGHLWGTSRGIERGIPELRANFDCEAVGFPVILGAVICPHQVAE